MQDRVVHEPDRSRFTLEAEGHAAVAVYERAGDVVTFTHTEVPEALGGKGVGSALVADALDMVRAEGLRVVARCPFVASLIAKHAEYQDLLADQSMLRKSGSGFSLKACSKLL